VAAGRLADKGLRVTIVEADLVGGECSHYACNALEGVAAPGPGAVRSAQSPRGRGAGTGSLDVAAVLSRRDMIVGHRRCSVVDAL
jgi:pyruvate/2-oxoglutarate dehydrogenase complex dihydrolipoamide dehydrogenase (E3) component